MSFSPQNQNYASSFSTTSQTSPDQTSSTSSSGTNGVVNKGNSTKHSASAEPQQQPHQVANVPTASSSASLSSPPSSFAMSAQNSQQQNSTSTNAFPTPASSVSGQFLSAGLEDGDGAAKGGGAGFESLKRKSEGAPDMMDVDVPMRNAEGGGHGAMTDQQVKYGSAMDVDPKETASTTEPSLAALQEDVGQAFHVCKTSYTASGPDPRLDLVSLYGLGPVAASVARTDPVTGEKINRLRKSYEGKIKLLGLSGRNKPVKSEPDARGGLRELMMWPEEEWYNQKVYGKEVKVAEPDSSLHKMHMRAMKFEPGSVPNNEYWEDVLGYEKQGKNLSPGEPGRKSSAYTSVYTSTPTARQSGQANGTPKATSPRPAISRPQRTGKKRSYTDDSFVGYAEAFAGDDDDDLEGGLYSGGDTGTGSSKKKRKKDHVSGVPSSVHGGSYGVGMYVSR